MDGIMAIPDCCENGWICGHTWQLWHECSSLVSGPGADRSCSLDWSETFLLWLSEPPRVQRTSEQKLWSYKCLLMCLKGPRVHLILLWSEDGNSNLTLFKDPIHHQESKRNGQRGGRLVKTPHINGPEAFWESCCFIPNTHRCTGAAQVWPSFRTNLQKLLLFPFFNCAY